MDIACITIFMVCAFYTSVGGIKAVIWTDVFQVIMIIMIMTMMTMTMIMTVTMVTVMMMCDDDNEDDGN